MTLRPLCWYTCVMFDSTTSMLRYKCYIWLYDLYVDIYILNLTLRPLCCGLRYIFFWIQVLSPIITGDGLAQGRIVLQPDPTETLNIRAQENYTKNNIFFRNSLNTPRLAMSVLKKFQTIRSSRMVWQRELINEYKGQGLMNCQKLLNYEQRVQPSILVAGSTWSF